MFETNKIDIKNCLTVGRDFLFFSFLLLPIITLAKLTRHDLYKDNHQATSTRIKEKTCQAVKLSSCQTFKLWSCLTTRNTSGRKFRWETFCVSCSFTLHIIDFTFKKNFSRYIRKYITKTIEYESGIYFSIGTTTLFIIPRFPNLIIHYLLLT